MKLSSRTQYAIKAMLELANSPKNSISLNSLSTTQNISLSYLEQIFAALRKNQLVKSVRGPGGGYLIAKPLETITVSDIVVAIDPQLSRCAEFQADSNMSKSMWNSLSHKIYGFLDSITLAQLMEEQDLLQQEASETQSSAHVAA
ncbi:MAG: Rrf2 family transcriptional regulator [Gammaproteobacteria bacterium]|nr:Rrf2 family transcriptional regulator [Gammaproteobacteria bacterium]MDH5651936.1 Rrf2 family transcriptional regulator [Gammaproteobacteria bacterium]